MTIPHDGNLNFSPLGYPRVYYAPSLPALTKRELFAAMAMTHLIYPDTDDRPEDVATDSIAFADALLAELEKEVDNG